MQNLTNCSYFSSKIKHVKNIARSKNNLFYGVVVLGYTLLLIAPGDKYIFLVSYFIVVGLFLILNNWLQALVLGFLMIAPFRVGQSYKYELLTPMQLNFNQDYINGRYIMFIISPKFILGFTIVLTIIFWLVKKFGSRNKELGTRLSAGVLLMITLAICRIFSSFQAVKFQTLSVLISLEKMFIAAWLLLAYLTGDKQALMKKAMYIVVCFTLLHNLIVLSQLVKGGAIGLPLESRLTNIKQEIAVDTNRPFGFEDHPNFMAYVMLFSFFVSIMLYSLALSNNKKVLVLLSKLAAFGSIISIVVSQSRAAYLGLTLGLLPLIYHYRYAVMKLFNKQLSFRTVFLTFILFIPILVYLPGRLVNTFLHSGGDYGAFSVRKMLAKEAINLIKEKSVWGVGTGMFIPTAFERNITGVMYWFPESVHNGFLLLTSEAGILSLIIGLILYFVVFRTILLSKHKSIIKLSVVGYLVAQLVFMFFHPIDGFSNLYLAFMLLLSRTKINYAYK